jgi:hypothetical protein
MKADRASTTPLADALAEVDEAQATARSHMPDGSLGDFPLPSELAALRALAEAVREHLATPGPVPQPWNGDAVKITGGTWDGHTGRVEHVNKIGSRRVRLDVDLPGIPQRALTGKLVTVQRCDLQLITKEGA